MSREPTVFTEPIMNGSIGEVGKALVQVELNRPSPKINTSEGEEE